MIELYDRIFSPLFIITIRIKHILYIHVLYAHQLTINHSLCFQYL